MALAEKRLLDVKKDFPNAMLANPDDVNVIFLLQEQPGRYHTSAVADATPAGYTRKSLLAGLARPLRAMARELT